MKNVLKVDHKSKTIVMDRTFAKKAEIVGSKEYNLLQTARRDYEGYTVIRREIKKNLNKECYRGLTYDYMRNYILSHTGAETMIQKFNELLLLTKCHSIRYPHIKKWFLDSYPEVVRYSTAPQIQAYDNPKKIA